MPSRVGVGLVVVFWLATTNFVFYRDILPRYTSEGPPPLRIDLVDEATQAADSKWSLYRTVNGELVKIGALTTEVKLEQSDGSFWYESTYRDTKFDFSFKPLLQKTYRIALPSFVSKVRVNRAGRLLEQKMDGRIDALELTDENQPDLKKMLGSAEVVELKARVQNGQLVGTFRIKSTFGNVSRDFTPVPVPDGQILNPMMPIGRLRDVTPGRRWVIRECDPLSDVIALLAKEANLPLSANRESRELIAEVRSQSERILPYAPLQAAQPEVDCWVIEYRTPGENLSATTWVSRTDGRVMRQEAVGMGEKLRFERDY